jgi:hypothetical protein
MKFDDVLRGGGIRSGDLPRGAIEADLEEATITEKVAVQCLGCLFPPGIGIC